MFTRLDFNDFLDKVLANNEAEIHVHDASKGLEEEAMVRMTISEFKWEFKDPGGALLSALTGGIGRAQSRCKRSASGELADQRNGFRNFLKCDGVVGKLLRLSKREYYMQILRFAFVLGLMVFG